jgi:hypothetical protein
MVARVKERKEFTYRCQICSMENLHAKMEQSVLPTTKLGKLATGETGLQTPLTLSDGSNLTLSDGTVLYLDTGMTINRGYETFSTTMYTATSISFIAVSGSVPAKLNDNSFRFGDQHIQSNMNISITTTSGVNDGNYTIADRGVSRGELSLSDSGTLTTESAAAAGSVIIDRILYKPNIITGCPFCGSLNSR